MNTTNSLPDLCELAIQFEECGAEENVLQCIVELRISNGEIPLGDEECEVNFGRLILSVDVEGIAIEPGSRYGEPLKKNAVAVTKTSNTKKSHNQSRRAQLTGSSAKIPEITADFDAGCSTRVEAEVSTIDEDHHLRVKARPNGRWEVTEPDRDILDGTYMQGDTLFLAKATGKANRRAACVQLKVKQRDLKINKIMRNESAVSFFRRISEDQKRLIDIFIAKSLSNATYSNRKYMGEITLSEHIFENFDNED